MGNMMILVTFTTYLSHVGHKKNSLSLWMLACK